MPASLLLWTRMGQHHFFSFQNGNITSMLDNWDQNFHFTLTHHQGVIIKHMNNLFCSMQDLTLLTKCLIEVLKVEAFDSYIKRSMGTMVIMKIENITWLAWFIKISNLDKNDLTYEQHASSINKKIEPSNWCYTCAIYLAILLSHLPFFIKLHQFKVTKHQL